MADKPYNELIDEEWKIVKKKLPPEKKPPRTQIEESAAFARDLPQRQSVIYLEKIPDKVNALYKKRNVVERFFRRLQDYLRITIRLNKLSSSFCYFSHFSAYSQLERAGKLYVLWTRRMGELLPRQSYSRKFLRLPPDSRQGVLFHSSPVKINCPYSVAVVRQYV